MYLLMYQNSIMAQVNTIGKIVEIKGRYSKNDSGQWFFKNYPSGLKKHNGKLGSEGYVKANVYVCLECGNSFPRIKCHIKNPDKPFCNYKCANGYNSPISSLKGNKHPSWKGGRRKSGNGYIKILKPEHPNSDSDGCVLEHRFVMEQKLNRLLFKHETVHHKNGKRDDNRIENLELWSTQHGKGQRVQDLIRFAKEILETYKDNQTE